MAFETPSYKGSNSFIEASVEQLQGQPQPQLDEVTPDGW
jgi:hypothetical protein